MQLFFFVLSELIYASLNCYYFQHWFGLGASVRELLRKGHDVMVMEQSGGGGGQWPYVPEDDGRRRRRPRRAQQHVRLRPTHLPEGPG